MRVLQIVNYLYPHIGGIEKVAQDISDFLSREGIDQRIICFNEDDRIDECETHRNQTVHDLVKGIPVIRCATLAKISSQAISLSFYRELKRIFDEFKPDTVIFHYPNPFQAQILRCFSKRKFRLLVWWHLDITKQKILKHLFHYQNIWLLKRADLVIAGTPRHLEESYYAEYMRGKGKVVPFVIDQSVVNLTETDKEAVETIRQQHQGVTICFTIGRHVPYKGLRYLIEASRILGEYPVMIYIAGKGPLTDDLKKQALGDSKVVFLGRISEEEKRVWLNACDIFCFPSITRNEAFGLAMGEAMLAGKPTITFTIQGSGVNYLSLNGKTGIECENGNSKQYAEAIMKMANDKNQREKLGRQASVRVETMYTQQMFSIKLKE